MKRFFLRSVLLFISVIMALQVSAQRKQKGFKFDDVMISIETPGNKSVAFATHDQRETITTEHRKPDFAGYLRNMWGMGYPTGTTTKNPLADDMTTAIVTSLKNVGFNATGVNVPFTDSHTEVLAKLKETDSELLIIFTLIEWHGDGYAKNTDVNYDVDFKVYDTEGTILAEKVDAKEGHIIGPDKPRNVWDQLKAELPKFFKEQMESFFNDPEVTKYLE